MPAATYGMRGTRSACIPCFFFFFLLVPRRLFLLLCSEILAVGKEASKVKTFVVIPRAKRNGTITGDAFHILCRTQSPLFSCYHPSKIKIIQNHPRLPVWTVGLYHSTTTLVAMHLGSLQICSGGKPSLTDASPFRAKSTGPTLPI